MINKYFNEVPVMIDRINKLDVNMGSDLITSLIYNYNSYKSINIDMDLTYNFWLLLIAVAGRTTVEKLILKTSQNNYYKINRWFEKNKLVKYTDITQKGVIKKVFDLHRIIISHRKVDSNEILY